jgi:hypothetical protein
MKLFPSRLIWQVPALLLACAYTAAPAFVTTTTFNFVGNCSDCTGTATAQLVLGNYTQGQAFSSSNFVSLTYSSNLLTFTLTQQDNPSVSGTIPANLPAAANVSIFGPGTKVLFTQGNGNWCSGNSCASDFGPTSLWSLPGGGAPTSVGAPALNDWMLISLAAAMAVMGGILVKRAQARNSV